MAPDKYSNKHAESGFVLPLAVLLAIVLAVSGASFMHLDSMERRLVLNEVDNHGAFYLANAGIERGRADFKIPQPDLTWDRVLNATYDGPDPDPNPDYALEAAPVFCPTCLCGPDPAVVNCVIPSFGPAVSWPAIPFEDVAFDDGIYEVRLFNNEPGILDSDQTITVRAMGTVRGEQKLLEADLRAVSGLDLINCLAPNLCPEVNGGVVPDAGEGREPEAHPTLPTLEFPLSDPQNYYRFDLHPSNFTVPGPALTVFTCATGIDCSKSNITIAIQSDSFYFVDKPDADVTLNSSGTRNRVVVYGLVGSGGSVIVKAGTNPSDRLDNTIIIGQGEIQMKDGNIFAPFPMPAVIAEGDVTQGSASVFVHGTIYATGTVNVNPVDVHGVVIGNTVQVQGSSIYTDDHTINPTGYVSKYYSLMPGFVYPQELITAVVTPGGWQEIE